MLTARRISPTAPYLILFSSRPLANPAKSPRLLAADLRSPAGVVLLAAHYRIPHSGRRVQWFLRTPGWASVRRHLHSQGVLKRSDSRKPGTTPEMNGSEPETDLHESPYTLPNALTLVRILACPFLSYTIVQGQFAWATGLLVASGFTDWLDGWLARRWNKRSVLGSILDPAADKALMTTLVVTLTWSGLLPLSLAILILGRDIALSLSAFYFRFISLPPPRTLRRYFDPTMPSAEVKPTQISKVNTALQLLLMGLTTASPLIPALTGPLLPALQWTVAGTTIWSGLSYLGRSGVRILGKSGGRM